MGFPAKAFLPLACLAVLLTACSTTRLLDDGQYRLAANEVRIEGDRSLPVKEVESYIRQKPNAYLIGHWNPFLYVYNWSGRNENKWTNRLLRKIGVAPVVYDASTVDRSVENIVRHLDYLGYYGSRVEAEVQVKNQTATVLYHVEPGRRFRIRSLDWELPDRGTFAADFLADTASISVQAGDYLSEQALEAETVRSATHFRELGYFDFSKNHYSFVADTLTFPGEALLTMRVSEHTRHEPASQASPLCKSSFGTVSVYHPATLQVRSSVLQHLNTIHPGQPYSERVVNNTYSRLSSMRLFSGVNIELTARDSVTVDCDINLTPSRIQGFKFNLEGSSNSSGLLGVSPEFSYFNKNIFHGGEWLNLSFMGNFQFRPGSSVRSNEFGVSAAVSFPKFVFLPYSLFDGPIPRTEIKASYNYQDRPEYQRNILSTSYGYSGNHRKLYFQIYPAQLNVIRLNHIDPQFYASLADNPFLRNAYQNHFDFGSGMTLHYTTNASVNPQTSYHYIRLQADVAGNVLSLFKPLMKLDASGAGMLWGTPFSQYVRGELTLGKTWRIGTGGRAVATRLLAGAGYAYGNSTVLPFEQHFYSGGANSMRGWQTRSVGPGRAAAETSFVIPNQTGDFKLEANLEYRYNLFWKIDGATFLDAGNVWTWRNSGEAQENPGWFDPEHFAESIAANWGLGLRLDLNFILIRFDLGMIVHDPSRADGDRWCGPDRWLSRNGYALHFGVGYPF